MTEYKFKLALSIVTANRPQQLLSSIKKIIKYLKDFNVAIYIFDGSSDDKTGKLINSLNDDNIIYAYYSPESTEKWERFYDRKKIPDAEFIWTLSDQRIPNKNTLSSILEILNKNIDLIVVNTMEIQNTKMLIYHNQYQFFNDYCWHMQLLGSNILGRRIIEYAWEKERIIEEIDLESSHIELREIFCILNRFNRGNYIFTKHYKNAYIKPIKTKTSATIAENRMFLTFIDRVEICLNLLPKEYHKYSKHVLKSMSTKTFWFTIDGFCDLKYLGALHTKQCILYYNRLKKVSNVPPFVIILISLLPKEIVKLIRDKIRKGREWKNRKY